MKVPSGPFILAARSRGSFFSLYFLIEFSSLRALRCSSLAEATTQASFRAFFSSCKSLILLLYV